MKRGKFIINAGTVDHPRLEVVQGNMNEELRVGYIRKKIGGKEFTAAYDMNTGLLIILQMGRLGCDKYITKHWESIKAIRDNPMYEKYKNRFEHEIWVHRREGFLEYAK